jgi:hypothetical protein
VEPVARDPIFSLPNPACLPLRLKPTFRLDLPHNVLRMASCYSIAFPIGFVRDACFRTPLTSTRGHVDEFRLHRLVRSRAQPSSMSDCGCGNLVASLFVIPVCATTLSAAASVSPSVSNAPSDQPRLGEIVIKPQ